MQQDVNQNGGGVSSIQGTNEGSNPGEDVRPAIGVCSGSAVCGSIKSGYTPTDTHGEVIVLGLRQGSDDLDRTVCSRHNANCVFGGPERQATSSRSSAAGQMGAPQHTCWLGYVGRDMSGAARLRVDQGDVKATGPSATLGREAGPQDRNQGDVVGTAGKQGSSAVPITQGGIL